MKIKVDKNKSNDPIILKLNRDKDSTFLWTGEFDGIWLKIYENETGSVNKIEKNPQIYTPDDEIISQFTDQKAQITGTESSGIEHTDENEAEEEPYPYDPDLIRVDPRAYQVNLVNELILENDIDLAPDFQRHFVWKDITQRSKLIESMMLRIPLPVFYMAQDPEGKFQVVDGLQRLTVINQFLTNQFKLKGLEYLKDCEGRYFKKEDTRENIDPKYARRISQTQLIFNVIDPQTPLRVKFDIFRRINQGGKPLNAQEIRNCMALKKTRKLLKDLANSDEFKIATNYSVNPVRMEDQELVLRFIGFHYSRNIENSLKYSGYMNDFLDNVIAILNNSKEPIFKKLSDAFYQAMNNAAYLFGNYAFRKCKKEHLKPDAGKQFINKSLFTTWSVLLSTYDTDSVKDKVNKKHLVIPLADEIENNYEYYDALTTGTNDMKKVQTSFRIANKILGINLW
ncbi:MAG: DUF262 domain-containing protein [Proteobacteria bacterium]|nr:DUF262 domain-containing protein [Pseudomonadota bacterium]